MSYECEAIESSVIPALLVWEGGMGLGEIAKAHDFSSLILMDYLDSLRYNVTKSKYMINNDIILSRSTI